jgi:diguanylate cyclase (GGDEF)-like protein
MNDRLNSARQYFATQADPYAGADMGNAQRLGALLWALVTVLIVLLWILSPPTEAIGTVGWIPAGVIAAVGALLVAALRRGRLITTYGWMLAISYGAVVAIAILQWLAGGEGSPYERVFLLPILYVAMLHPPRRIAAFMGFVALAMAAPFIYDGWNSDAAGATFATFVIWSALAALGSVLMSGVRAQRLALAHEEAQARQEARIDKLTGLHNRRGFDETLEREVERARRHGTRLSVAMIDIHSFKKINDGWGHAEGDRCLREVAVAISTAVRQPDLCFRWGGDEFALILTGTGAGAAAPLGARLKGIVYTSCRRPDDEPMEVTFAVAELGEGMPASELGEMAGMALTAAKSATKDPIEDLDEDRF